jgi:hypothetical protein
METDAVATKPEPISPPVINPPIQEAPIGQANNPAYYNNHRN